VNQKRCLFLQPLLERKRSFNTCDLRIFPVLTAQGSGKKERGFDKEGKELEKNERGRR